MVELTDYELERFKKLNITEERQRIKKELEGRFGCCYDECCNNNNNWNKFWEDSK